MVTVDTAELSWAEWIQNLEPGTRRFFQFPYASADSQSFGLSSTAFPDQKQETGEEVEQQGQESRAHMGILCLQEED